MEECIEAPSTREREVALIYFEASPRFALHCSIDREEIQKPVQTGL